MKCVFDLEGDNLLPKITNIWCGVFTDVHTNKKYQFTPDDLTEMLIFMDSCSTLIGHNIIGFDFPALKKILNYTFKGKIIDTLVLSTLYNPDRYGGHSVANWAKLLKLSQQKVEHEDWSVFSLDMLHRCSTDVDIQVDIYNALLKESKKDNIDWSTSERIEADIRGIISSQESVGVPFNTLVAKDYLNTLNGLIKGISDDVYKTLGNRVIRGDNSTTHIYKKDGSHTSYILNRFSDDFKYYNFDVVGEFCKIDFEQITLSMYKEVKQKLITFGWTPTQYTEKGSPKMPSVEELEELSIRTGNPNLKVISKYGSYANRRNIIKKWIEIAEDNHNKLPAGAFTNGTNTARFKHTVVVNVPKASSDKNGLIWYPEYQPVFFGTEMRSLFYSGEDPSYKMVGADAAGLEIRCLAHYLEDNDFNNTVLKGDVHTLFWKAAGYKDWIESRNDMKSVFYAWIYGAGDLKIASLCTAKKGLPIPAWGRQVKANLLSGVNGLKDLMSGVIKASRRGYLIGLDGRKIIMRKSNGEIQTHKSLNTLLQSTGSILIKHWTILVNNEVKINNINAKQVIHMHDEMQWLCYEEDVNKLSAIIKQAMIQTGKDFNFFIPLEADINVGNNWAETH